MIVYPQAVETDLTSPTTVQDANFVSVINTAASAAQITIEDVDSAPAAKRTITLGAGERLTIKKQKTDTMEGGVAFKAVPVIRTQ